MSVTRSEAEESQWQRSTVDILQKEVMVLSGVIFMQH